MGINCENCNEDCENYYLFSELYNMCLCTILYRKIKLDDKTSKLMYYFVYGVYCSDCYVEKILPLPKCPMCKKEVTKKQHN